MRQAGRYMPEYRAVRERHTTDLHEALALQTRLNRFMDAILLGLISGFEGDGTTV